MALLEKVCFCVRPDSFETFDRVDEDGSLSFCNMDEFNLPEEYQRIYLTGTRVNLGFTKFYLPTVKDKFNKVKFKIRFQRNKKEKAKSVTFFSKELEIRTPDAIKRQDTLCTIEQRDNFFRKLMKNDVLEDYFGELNNFIFTARKKRNSYYKVIDEIANINKQYEKSLR